MWESICFSLMIDYLLVRGSILKVISNTNRISHFNINHKPVVSVELDEVFILETVDCYNGQIKDEKTLRKDIDSSQINLATGPVYINGVYPGDTIAVEILDIQLLGNGIMPIAPGSGILRDYIEKYSTKIIEIKKSKALFAENLFLDLNPMIGIIGVTPDYGEVPCSIQGNHGGNLDTKEITIGSNVYLPVFVEGALLAIGDLHACMGDGEISGTGVEIAGKVKLKIKRIPETTIELPVITTDEEIIIVASDKSFDMACKRVALIGINIIKRTLGLNFADSYRLMSAACDLRISQVVNQLLTVKIIIPKYIFNGKRIVF